MSGPNITAPRTLADRVRALVGFAAMVQGHYEFMPAAAHGDPEKVAQLRAMLAQCVTMAEALAAAAERAAPQEGGAA